MNSLLETLKQLGPARLGIMGAMLVGLLLFFVFVSFRVSAPEMKLLYSDLNSTDSAAIAAKLEESEIRYEVSPDGARITVPEDQVGKARMLLAAAGLPGGGSMGYEIFDEQSGFGTTNFVQNINQVRALEGELSKTISAVESVRNARVHLVLPQRELFSRESRPASASVFIGTRPGAQITREQILAIQSLVASAVPDLKASDVSIIDSNGNLLARGEGADVNLTSIKAEEMRRSLESNLTQKVEDQVSRVVGYGKVRATVTTEMNFDQISTNEEMYDPEQQVVRSSQVVQENSTERDTGAKEVSVEKNLPSSGEDLLVGKEPSAESNRTEEITNFEISRTVRSTTREVGEIKRLSVAVLVDGTYKVDDTGNRIYEPRKQEELDRITALVRSAVGFDEQRGDKVDVVNMQFADADVGDDLLAEELFFGFSRWSTAC
ncbi:MAG: flagellar M-ring protein FliF [Alphaproteobacteria bacterium]|nr:flagellar M-ring protein FliF [Alphaproteobacteria bacterium]